MLVEASKNLIFIITPYISTVLRLKMKNILSYLIVLLSLISCGHTMFAQKTQKEITDNKYTVVEAKIKALEKESNELIKIQKEFDKTLSPSQSKQMKTLSEKYREKGKILVAPYLKKYGSNPKSNDAAKMLKELEPQMLKIKAEGEKELASILKPNQIEMVHKIKAKTKELKAKNSKLLEETKKLKEETKKLKEEAIKDRDEAKKRLVKNDKRRSENQKRREKEIEADRQERDNALKARAQPSSKK